MNALRILHVDDESALTNLFRIMLEGTGRYEVRAECSANRALDAAREFRPDLILLDKGLDERDGEEIAAEFQKDPQLCNVPIGFLTGSATKDEASATKGIPTASKPISAKELLTFVDDLLNFNAACVGC